MEATVRVFKKGDTSPSKKSIRETYTTIYSRLHNFSSDSNPLSVYKNIKCDCDTNWDMLTLSEKLEHVNSYVKFKKTESNGKRKSSVELIDSVSKRGRPCKWKQKWLDTCPGANEQIYSQLSAQEKNKLRKKYGSVSTVPVNAFNVTDAHCIIEPKELDILVSMSENLTTIIHNVANRHEIIQPTQPIQAISPGTLYMHDMCLLDVFNQLNDKKELVQSQFNEQVFCFFGRNAFTNSSCRL